MIKTITTAVDKELKSVAEVSFYAVEAEINAEGMNELSESLEALSHQFHIGDKKFHIGEVKLAHLAWSTNLEAVIRGVKDMKPEDVTLHTECELGKWYFGEGKTYSSLDVYQEMGIWHEKIHNIAKEVVTLCANGEKEKALPLLEDFKEARVKLFATIDSIYVD